MAMEQEQGNGTAVLMAIAIGLIGFGLGWFVGNSNVTSDSADQEAAAVADIDGVGDSDTLPIGDSPVMGNPEAPVTIVEFTSMQCPFCARAADTLKELVEEYPDDVRLVFKHFPLPMQEQAEPASKVLVATQKQDADKFWEMKDMLFERIDDYDAQPMEELGAELAEDLGLDVDQFREDYNSDDVSEVVNRDRQLGQDLGVRGTPHFFINGEVVNGAQPLEEFASVVDRQLELIDELREDGVADEDLYAAAIDHNLDAGDDEEEAQREQPEPEDDTEVHHVDIRDHDPIKGADADDALVTIMEFSSFQCPHCARSAETLEELVEKYPDEVRIVFKHFPLSMQQHSEPASRASVAAANQGKFWEMYDALYENQRNFNSNLWEELAADIGLDMDQFKQDFEADETAEIVEQAQADGRSAGIRGTPGFLINGIQETGAQPLRAFEGYVDEQIEIAKKIRDDEGLSGDELYEAVVAYNKENAGGGAPEPEPEADDDSDFDPDDLSVGDSYTKGADDPELKIYEFSSFQCPFCARAADTMADVIDEYGDQVQLVYKNFPLPFQDQSEPAARAALAAGEQGQFWDMYEALYDNQDDFGDGLWEELARDIGLNVDQFRADFESDEIANRVEEEQAEGRSVGVQGTPAFFIGEEELSGAQPIQEFRNVIDRQLDG